MRCALVVRSLCATFLFALAARAADAPPVALPPGVPIIVAASEGPAVRAAVDDLRRDLKRVLGKDSRIFAAEAEIGGAAGGAAIVVTSDPKAQGPDGKAPESPEGHAVYLRATPGGPRLVLQGADPRGTVYAVYTFCDQFLDVPPLWFWASWQAGRKDSIPVSAGTNLRFAPPQVRWRAWFPNDMDLLTPWETGPAVGPKGNFDLVLETMLRLKLNAIDLDDLRDYPTVSLNLQRARAARDRGLAVTTTHTSPFGAFFKWWVVFWRQVRQQQQPPLLSIADPASLETYWRYHAEMIKREKLEMIWMVGFRGQGDHPYYENVQGAPPDDAGRARVLREMLDRQVAIVKSVTGDEHPPMRTVLYNECADYFAKGLLRPPDEPSLIWNFCGARRDHFPGADLRGFNPAESKVRPRPVGYYLNLQFTSTGSHLAEGEGPWKMEKNFRYVGGGQKGRLDFSVVNVGNVREFVLGLSANARMLWGFDPYDTDSFVKEYAARYFGPDRAGEIAALVKDYFDSYWQQRKPDLPDFPRQYLFQDLRMSRAGQTLLAALELGTPNLNPLNDQETGLFRIVPEDNNARDQIAALIAGTEGSIAKLRDVSARADGLAKSIPPARLRFFDDNVRAPVRFMLGANAWLNDLARAVQAMPDKKKSKDWLAKSDKDLDATWAALASTQHDAFRTWYMSDGKFNFGVMKQKTLQLLQRQ